MFIKLQLFFLFLCIIYIGAQSNDQRPTQDVKSGRYVMLEGFRRRCPLCDSSVFSYCSDKLFHDSCCCSNPNNPYYPLPYQCQFADCSFLHSNTCEEHKLITACCCLNHLSAFQRV